MEQTLRAQHREARREGTVRALVRLWLDVARDVFTTAPREHVAILRQDVGYALRSLRRAPVFAASAVLTLAIGMSAMTGMVAVLNAVMLRPLAVDHPEQLISISNQDGIALSCPTGTSWTIGPKPRCCRMRSAPCRAPPPSAWTGAPSASLSSWSPTTTSRCWACSLRQDDSFSRMRAARPGTLRSWFCPTRTGSRASGAIHPSSAGRYVWAASRSRSSASHRRRFAAPSRCCVSRHMCRRGWLTPS